MHDDEGVARFRALIAPLSCFERDHEMPGFGRRCPFNLRDLLKGVLGGSVVFLTGFYKH